MQRGTRTGAPAWQQVIQELRPVVGRLPRYVNLARLILLRRGATGPRRIVLGGLAYLLSPIDPIPGFLPLIGQLDDLLVALYTLRWALGALPPGARARVLQEAGLEYWTLEQDLRLVTKVAARLAAEAGRGLLHVARRVGRWLGRALGGSGGAGNGAGNASSTAPSPRKPQAGNGSGRVAATPSRSSPGRRGPAPHPGTRPRARRRGRALRRSARRSAPAPGP